MFFFLMFRYGRLVVACEDTRVAVPAFVTKRLIAVGYVRGDRIIYANGGCELGHDVGI